jgi:hypothetical protein
MSNGTTTSQQSISGPFTLALTVADKYGPTGLLVLALTVGMWFTTTWLRDESAKNDQNNLEQQNRFIQAIDKQQSRFDTMLEREHREFQSSLNAITKSFQDAMDRRKGQ